MKKYSLKKSGSLYYTKAAVIGDTGVLSFDLLVDTGSTFTIIPVESLKILGYDIASSKERVRLITGSGYIYAPKINVQWIQSLGCKFESFPVVAHTLPPEMYFKGILGMDFLKQAEAIINTFQGEIEIRA
jgi:predicted aspartyl protease